MKNGRKALIDLQVLINLQVSHDLKFMLQVDYLLQFSKVNVLLDLL
jgi:hypothetical protein